MQQFESFCLYKKVYVPIFNFCLVTLLDILAFFQLIPPALITPVAGMPVIAARVLPPIAHPTAQQSPERVAPPRPFAPA